MSAHPRATLQAEAPLLATTALECCYGRIRALKGIAVHVNEGETVALVGANGRARQPFYVPFPAYSH